MQQASGGGHGGNPPLAEVLRLGMPSIVFALIVAAAAIFSFTPRALPDFPPTQLDPSQILVTDVTRVGSRYLVVGERGRILHADQPDGPWQEAERAVARGSTLTAVHAVDDDLVFALGHDLWILRSEDGGRHWDEVHFDEEFTEPLLSLAATPDGSRLVAVGGFGQYLVSEDAGRSWSNETHEAAADWHLNDIVRGPDGTMLIAGEGGMVLRSRDNAQSWERLPVDYHGSLFGALALGGDAWLVFGMRGNAFRTDDGGDSWHTVDTGTSNTLFGGYHLADGLVVLVGAMNTVLRSDSRLQDFVPVKESRKGALSAVLLTDDGELLVGGENGLSHLRLPEADATAGGAS